MSDPTGIVADEAYTAGYADGTRDVQARVDAAVEARLARVRQLCGDLLDHDPGHGDFLTAGKSLRAALRDATHTDAPEVTP